MIETEAFTVEELVSYDAPAVNSLMVSNTERFQRFFPMTLNQNRSVKASEEFIARKQKKHAAKTEFTWGIRNRSSKKIIGLLILKELDWKKGVGEFAYCIDTSYEGMGWISRIVKEASRYAFEDLKLNTLQIIAHHTNRGSIRVAEKCNFKWQQTLKACHTPPGESPLDMELYELYNER